ncbi:MAG: response regulator transcription factor [Clostridiaceae bacterium]|nr:response regulator transcription factor [Clostridiaceae bacterium]
MKILIVDDDDLIRDGLKMILETEEGFSVVGTASNGEEAVKICWSTQPDIILMDIRMPIMDGVHATKLIKEQFKNIKILLLTTFKDTEYIRSAVKYGAEGYVLKSNSTLSIIESIKTIFEGNVVYEKQIAGLLSEMLIKEKKIPKEFPNITSREYEIMEFLSKGSSNKEISEKLFIGEGTVRNNISVLLDKLNLRDRTQLAIYFIRNLEK